MEFFRRVLPTLISLSRGSAFGLGFLCCLLFFSALALHYPRFALNANYQLQFGYLNLTKQKVAEKTIKDDAFRFYRESDAVQVANVNSFEEIAIEAYESFPIYINSRHGNLILEKQESGNVHVVFASPGTLLAYEFYYGEAILAVTMKNYIYLKSSENGRFDVQLSKTTIRHEIFHYLCNVYGLTGLIPHTEAYEFAAMRS